MRFPHKAERVSLPHRKVVALGKLDMTNYNNNAGIPVGFRFHPTDEELVGCYLYSRIARPPPPLDPLEEDPRIIRELDLYRHEPWHLSEVCKIPGDHSANQNNWYFFSHKDKKYPTGNRANRATKAGFWKATGRDKCIQTRGAVGMRKTLVFYRGRAPHGQKSDWIMHEFRLDVDGNQLPLPNFASSRTSSGSDLEDAGAWVVCRVFRKTKNLKSKEDNSNDTPTTSVEEDHQMALLPEITDSTEKFSSDEGEHVDYPPADHMQQQQHFHPDYSHVQQPCKQELLSVNDYAVEHHCAVFQTFEGTPAMSPSSMFRTSSCATGTNPNYNTFLDPPPPVLFEHQMLEAMPYCSSSNSSSAPSSSSAHAAAALFSPSPNNPYQLAMPEENLPRADSRGLSSYRHSPAALDGLGDFRTEIQVPLLLDQSRMDALTGPRERQQQQLQHAQEILRFTSSHDMVPFGMSWGPRSNAGGQFGDFCLGSDLNPTFLSSGDHHQH